MDLIFGDIHLHGYFGKRLSPRSLFLSLLWQQHINSPVMI